MINWLCCSVQTVVRDTAFAIVCALKYLQLKFHRGLCLKYIQYVDLRLVFQTSRWCEYAVPFICLSPLGIIDIGGRTKIPQFDITNIGIFFTLAVKPIE